jgi:hypothetical protein
LTDEQLNHGTRCKGKDCTDCALYSEGIISECIELISACAIAERAERRRLEKLNAIMLKALKDIREKQGEIISSHILKYAICELEAYDE